MGIAGREEHPSARPRVNVTTYDLLSSGDSLVDLKSLNSVKITQGTANPVLSAWIVIILGRDLSQVHWSKRVRLSFLVGIVRDVRHPQL
jgi:hypothetical protein